MWWPWKKRTANADESPERKPKPPHKKWEDIYAHAEVRIKNGGKVTIRDGRNGQCVVMGDNCGSIVQSGGRTFINGVPLEEYQGSGQCLKGNGNMKQVERPLDAPIHKLKSKISCDISIKTGQENERCVLSMEENLIDCLEIIHVNGVFEPKFTKGFIATKPVLIELFLKNAPAKYRISGSGNIEIDRVQLPEMDWDISGSSDVEIHASEVERANFDVSGSSDITCAGNWKAGEFSCCGSSDFKFQGHIGDLKIRCSGSSDMKISEADNVELRLSGSSEIKVKANKSLTGSICGSSEVRYSGDCKVELDKTKGCKVVKRG